MKNTISEIRLKTGEIVNAPDPKEFGLTVQTANNIMNKFVPSIAERDQLIPKYMELIDKKINKTVELEAKELDKQFQKISKSIDETHKAEKNMYLQAGRFVDVQKNREKLPITQMREKLKEIATTTKRKEAAKIEKLEVKRTKELIALGMMETLLPADLGTLDDAVYDHYKSGVEATAKAKADADKKAKEEAEKAQKAAAKQKTIDDAALAKANIEKAQAKKQADELAAKLKAKEDAERILLKRKQDLLVADDQVKFDELISSIEALKTKFTFKSDKNQKKLAGFVTLADKTIEYLKK